MTNKIIAQSARFRAVRTSRDRVRIKDAIGKVEHGSFVRMASGDWVMQTNINRPGPDFRTFAEAVHQTLTQEAK